MSYFKVQQALRQTGLQSFGKKFRDEGLNDSVLSSLSSAEFLKEVMPRLGDRIKFLEKFKEINKSTAPQNQAQSQNQNEQQPIKIIKIYQRGRGRGGHCRGQKQENLPVNRFQQMKITRPKATMNNLPLPDLEHILIFLNGKDLLNARKVCHSWKNIISSRPFWRKYYSFRKKDLDSLIPRKYNAHCGIQWVLFYLQHHKEIFTKNYIKNSSGLEGFKNWIKKDGGNGWIVEIPPNQVKELPKDNFFKGEKDSCFVSSYSNCILEQTFNLREQGLTFDVLNFGIPFSFEISVLIATRFDCGGKYKIRAEVLEGSGNIVHFNEKLGEIPPKTNWQPVSFNLWECKSNVELNKKDFPNWRIKLIISGSDNKFWKGHFGTKFSRAQIKFNATKY